MDIKRTAGITFRRPIRTPRVLTLRGSAWSRLLLTVATLCILGVTRQATVQAIDDLTRRFQAGLDRLQQAEGFPGATAAFALPDGRVVGVATGVADRETGAPMTSDTRMLAASIGKMFGPRRRWAWRAKASSTSTNPSSNIWAMRHGSPGSSKAET